MTGKEIFESLPVEVQEKIKVNVREQIKLERPDFSVGDRMDYLMSEDYGNDEGFTEKYWFVSCLFKWYLTTEGRDYWNKIANS